MMILHLTLKKKWFDLIKAGVKKQEYRAIKPYWEKRFEKIILALAAGVDVIIRFKNGYNKNSPVFDIELKAINRSVGLPEWGAPIEKVFALDLGKVA